MGALREQRLLRAPKSLEPNGPFCTSDALAREPLRCFIEKLQWFIEKQRRHCAKTLTLGGGGAVVVFDAFEDQWGSVAGSRHQVLLVVAVLAGVVSRSPWRSLLVACALSCGCSLPPCRSAATPKAGAQGAQPSVVSPVATSVETPDASAAPRVEPTEPPPPPSFPTYAGHEDDQVVPPIRIEFADALAPYFRRLTLTDLKVPTAITRAGHWGDSVLGGDGLTGRVRNLLQERFGDAGHGFHALSKYSRWYRHHGVKYAETGKWDTCEIIFKCRDDGFYGYAGVTSRSSYGQARFQTTQEGPGSRVSRFELWYSERPGGGSFRITVDGDRVHTISARGEVVADRVHTVRLPDGPHDILVEARGPGAALGYGAVLERDGPGVVWDELSLIGSFTQRLDYQDAGHLAAQLRARGVHLMVFMLGGNDLQRAHSDLKTSTARYEAEYERVIAKFRAGAPDAACMIMATTDHAKKRGGRIVSRKFMPRLVAAQRAVAERKGCAFFDSYAAMGGEGSVARWARLKPRLVAPDLRHLTKAGQKQMGTYLYQALMLDYASYRRARSGQPLPELYAESRLGPSPASGAEGRTEPRGLRASK